MNKSMQRGKAPLVRKLMRATGLSREGVYLCLRENRPPRNPVAANAWKRVMAKGAK